ncbi:MAG: nitrite reductase large subunit NirB [Lentisphaeria bacterium]|nr:nitrite reductase large subunit NirB [Lentisphaeria bacterium]
MGKERVVVIGNGMVGAKFCERLLEKETNKEFEIITFCEEVRPAYDRVHLSEYFGEKGIDELTLKPLNWYQENGITIFLGDRANKIDREKQIVYSEKGESVKYDYVVLATGSYPFVPPIPGVDKKGVFVYRTIEDLDAMMDYAQSATNCAVVGGGLLGLEAAKAAQDLQLNSHVVEFAPRLMPRQLDTDAGEVLKKLIEDRGLQVHLNTATKEIIGEEKVEGMLFNDGEKLDVDMVIVSAGIRPRDDIAQESGLEIGPRGGIQVNDNLQTSDPKIFAIGECALHEGMIYGLVAPGYTMADVVAQQLAGHSAVFTGADMSTKLKLIGTDVASFGNIEPKEGTFEELTINDPYRGIFKRLFITEDGQRLLGGILVGEADEYGQLLQLYLNEMKLPENPMQLILPASDGEAVGGGVEDLPDGATICSCENVTKGDICCAIEGGAQTIPDLKSCTKAGTGCGGCVPLVTDLLKYKLKEAGVEVSNALCEHFDFSRTEMYEIIRATGIKSFDELIHKHGKGTGCEICKPTAASIFASTWNEPILTQPHLQDSNDAFLANIQKNGSYSIVPRIPGGEITPEKLIILGQIAKEYNLYTKITGGQRIDLFGAQLNELPLIWRELIDAGFESGHAYGKSIRTVKSCVGSTWCRFGVQDSVGMAILIEERYRGIRSPHKLKSAVSGCTRECAEAQSKDFGIIATDKGWNLYVCGNGGMKPRHADLLAGDLDDETLIKYIDRFLMFYIKTAERLTRTSVWLEKLEGGLDHLKDVVINDSLGICNELEEQMEYLVNTYECEWKNAIEDPEKAKRFRHFVNSDEKDENLVFKLEREQIRPATDKEREELAKI